MPITFPVDDVPPAAEPLPTRPLSASFPSVLALGGDPDLPTLDTQGVHPLLAAVHRAFAEHRPLVLSPDAVWLTIAEGVAQHVRLHADALRGQLVRHEGRETVTVISTDRAPTTAESWGEVVDAFRAAVGPRLQGGLASLLVCDFSTTTDVERVASEIVLLDAVSPYFDFKFLCVCGIPSITLTGTPEDWRGIQSRIPLLDDLGLGFWTKSLRRIADELVAAAEGRPNTAFWQAICKPREAYGPERVTGWIGRLYPYVKDGGRMDGENPLLAVPIGREHEDHGIDPADVPARHSSAVVRVEDRVAHERYEVTLEGGLVAVAQDADGALRPVAGYAVRRAEVGILDVIDRIVAEHAFEPPTDKDRRNLSGTAEMIALADRIRSAELFAGTRPWRIRPASEHTSVHFAGPERIIGSRLVDLPDGRCIVIVYRPRELLAVCDASRIAPPPAPDRYTTSAEPGTSLPIVGRSLAPILARALDTGGDPDLPLLATIGDLLYQRATLE